jgi:hypothetical protein
MELMVSEGASNEAVGQIFSESAIKAAGWKAEGKTVQECMADTMEDAPDFSTFKVKELKEFITTRGGSLAGLAEKADLIGKCQELHASMPAMAKAKGSSGDPSITLSHCRKAGFSPQDIAAHIAVSGDGTLNEAGFRLSDCKRAGLSLADVFNPFDDDGVGGFERSPEIVDIYGRAEVLAWAKDLEADGADGEQIGKLLYVELEMRDILGEFGWDDDGSKCHFDHDEPHFFEEFFDTQYRDGCCRNCDGKGYHNDVSPFGVSRGYGYLCIRCTCADRYKECHGSGSVSIECSGRGSGWAEGSLPDKEGHSKHNYE